MCDIGDLDLDPDLQQPHIESVILVMMHLSSQDTQHNTDDYARMDYHRLQKFKTHDRQR